MQKTQLIGLSKEEIASVLQNLGEKPFRAKQLWHWLYHQGVTDFDKMTSFSKETREKLKQNCKILRPRIVKEQISEDKTHKWLLEFEDGARIETVYIPEEDRGAVCVSTQVGCPIGCKFCHTGSQKFTRNLTTAEIVAQFMVARDAYNEWPTPKDETRYLSNIVVMGMGEPLLNVDNAIKALQILNDHEGISISKRKITLSTSGIAPNILRVAKEVGCRLAISLHAPTDEKRCKIMPINNKYNIDTIMKACQQYQKAIGNRQCLTFEYILLDGINDSLEDAKDLINLVKKYDLGVKFNLIPFNPWKGIDFKPSSVRNSIAFAKKLQQAGYAAPIRVARGQDILAACGQLKSSV